MISYYSMTCVYVYVTMEVYSSTKNFGQVHAKDALNLNVASSHPLTKQCWWSANLGGTWSNIGNNTAPADRRRRFSVTFISLSLAFCFKVEKRNLHKAVCVRFVYGCSLFKKLSQKVWEIICVSVWLLKILYTML